MSAFQSITNNPILGYRLDPYEPGFIRRAKTSQSTAQVVSHEHRNLTRLTRQAVQEGRVIIRKQITYRPTVAGSYMGTVAGKTTVVSMEKAKTENADPVEKSVNDDKNKETYPSDSTDTGGGGLSNNMQSELAQVSLEELNQEEQKLKTEIRRINNEIEQAEKENEHSSDVVVPPEEEESKEALRIELEKKKQDLRDVTQAKISKSQADLMATINEGLEKSNEAVMGMLKAAYDTGNDSIGQNFDLFV